MEPSEDVYKRQMYDWVLEETALIEAEVFLEE